MVNIEMGDNESQYLVMGLQLLIPLSKDVPAAQEQFKTLLHRAYIAQREAAQREPERWVRVDPESEQPNIRGTFEPVIDATNNRIQSTLF